MWFSFPWLQQTVLLYAGDTIENLGLKCVAAGGHLLFGDARSVVNGHSEMVSERLQLI